ncbi:MAG: DUF1987 domain-containing protein [Flavobacteriia bacterium]|nr:DUF1987 domain-containing protein [Flavobacteriia bacterium]
MKRLIINKTETSPFIDFCFESRILQIQGQSTLDEVIEFYTPVIEWIRSISQKQNIDFTFILEMEYFNFESSMMLFEILTELEKVNSEGKNSIDVIWNYDERDEDMVEAIEKYSEIIQLPFVLNKM